MKQKKKHNDKGKNTINMKNKRTAASTTATYKPMISNTNKYQKYNYYTQTDNSKDNSKNTDMSVGLEDKKKLKTKTMDQKEEKPSSPKESVTTTPSSQLSPSSESEAFDSSSDNATSEMNKVADMGPDETSMAFSHLKEKQQLDPSTADADDIIRKTKTENSLDVNPATANPTLHETDHTKMESKEDVVLTEDAKPEISHVPKESENQGQIGESVRFNDESGKEHNSNSSNSDDENNNPFTSGIKLLQDYIELWNNAYRDYVKTWGSIV